MITIYHNPRCSKSRETLEILQKSNQDFQIVNYLEESLNIEELKKIIKLLNINPIDLIRKNETIWKDNFKNSLLNDDELLQIMQENPKLIERPIVINGNKAIIGRPPTNILNIL